MLLALTPAVSILTHAEPSTSSSSHMETSECWDPWHRAETWAHHLTLLGRRRTMMADVSRGMRMTAVPNTSRKRFFIRKRVRSLKKLIKLRGTHFNCFNGQFCKGYTISRVLLICKIPKQMYFTECIQINCFNGQQRRSLWPILLWLYDH